MRIGRTSDAKCKAAALSARGRSGALVVRGASPVLPDPGQCRELAGRGKQLPVSQWAQNKP